jgi:Holliday junction resolvasome RuvABC endonuclease subunit
MHNNYLLAIEALVRNASELTTDAEVVAREAEDVTAQHLLAINKQLNEVLNIIRQRLVAVERVKEIAA